MITEELSTNGSVLGSVGSLWRYPVKSMMGEQVESVWFGDRGVLGDRGYALIDRSTGKVASAKNPRKWMGLFGFEAAFVEPPERSSPLPPAAITLPDGKRVLTSSPEADAMLSAALDREVTIASAPPDKPGLEEYWPDIANLAHRDEVTDEAIPPGTFFDGAPVHLITTSTLAALSKAYPDGRFEPRRFRPNLLIVTPDSDSGFIENSWVGKTIALGPEVLLQITVMTGRCVMTTLSQGELPRDIGILKTAVKENGASVGVYATVRRGGIVKQSDAVRFA